MLRAFRSSIRSLGPVLGESRISQPLFSLNEKSAIPLGYSRSLGSGSEKVFDNFSLKSGEGSQYGGRRVITLIPGDGVGMEISESIKAIFTHAGVPITWEEFSFHNVTKFDSGLMNQVISSIDRNKVALKGVIHTPVGLHEHKSFNLYIRRKLDMFASLCHIKTLPGAWKPRFNDVDLIIFRENTEGEYSGLEHSPVEGVVESLKVVSYNHTKNLAKMAFDYCVMNNRKMVSIVHKANIMKKSDGLFMDTVLDIAKVYEPYGITCNNLIVDNASMQLVLNPSKFDVVICGNLYGSILANIGAGLVGGAGVVAGSNFGYKHSIFEPGCRHPGISISGKNQANPMAFIISAINMLNHIGMNNQYSKRISDSLYKTIKDKNNLTPDLGGTNTTVGFTKAIIKNIV